MSIARSIIALTLLLALVAPAIPAEGREGGETVLPPSSEVFADGPRPVMDSLLVERLAEFDRGEDIEVVVQFRDLVTAVDTGFTERLGIEVVHRYSAIPAVWARGPASAFRTLARYEGTWWMEYNERLDYMMERSVSTINASKTWVSPVLDRAGDEVDLGTRGGGIDGTGVTVVVLDSGIDAGHPDLDYGEKTIMNLKSDTGNGPWYELENGDTSMGHGTHCAGTVAGNGDASGGARRGVAPGANLIGLSAGDALYITGAVGGMEWVYENSKPPNTYNIRAVSNSWGSGGGEYDPQDALAQLTEKITYENNVMVVFAAGNSGGDGTDIQSSNYGNAPAALCIAALERDGSGVAEFSSRGRADLNQTFPDVGAPGVKIWSTAARRTWISAMTKQPPNTIDPYYFAISGTSMATPHVAGLTALLWQAYPGLRVSEIHEHYQEGGDVVIDDWYQNPNTRIHEIEAILECTARYILPGEDNGVPDPSLGGTRTGHNGRPYDFAQGYGCVQADRAVALALTLKEMRTRDLDGDGEIDYPDATVLDALKQYRRTMKSAPMAGDTDTLVTDWTGEWSRFNNETSQLIPFTHDQSHMVFVPVEATEMILELSYEAVSTTEKYGATLNLVIDYDMDGRPDWTQTSGMLEGHALSQIDLTQGGFADARGELWSINIEGRGFQLPGYDLRKGEQFVEIRVEYDVSVALIFEMGNGTVELEAGHMAPYVAQFRFGDPSAAYTPEQGRIVKTMYVYDMGEVGKIGEKKKAGGVNPIEPWWAVLAAIIVMGVLYLIWYYWKKRRFPLIHRLTRTRP